MREGNEWHYGCGGRAATKGTAMKLKDQVAIVTGAGRNIGEEIAKLFAAEGAKVAIVDMSGILAT